MDTNVLRQVQRALMARGYDVGKSGADGIAGRMTRSATAKFQADERLPIKYPGTIGPITLKALGLHERTQEQILPPWVAEGLRKKGLHERLNNKELREYLKSDGATLGDPAVLPWCGDFQETIIALTLPEEPMISNPYWAANWLKFGVSIPPGVYFMGAIGVKKRDGGNHVFTIVGHDANHVHALGGNQSDKICIVKIAKKDITGMRWPSTYPYPTEEMPMTVFDGSLSIKED